MSSPQSMKALEAQGPPYPPTVAMLGGAPTTSLDVPLACVFLVLYVGAAVGHMTILQLNLRRQHKFLMSGVMFGFCMSRIVTMSLRIAWAYHIANIRLAIAANIFVAAGVLLLFIINLLLSQRIVRATHPKFGWSKLFSWPFRVLYFLIPLILAMIITVTVQSFFTLDLNIKLIDHHVQLGGQTFLLFVAFLPLPIVALAAASPRTNDRPLEKFGEGRWRIKVTVLLVAASLLCLGAGFRVGTNFMPPRPIDDPAWYQSKACFWIFNFTLEILVVYLYLAARIDLRFHVPNQSRAAGGYANAASGVPLERTASDSSEDRTSSVEGAEPMAEKDQEASRHPDLKISDSV